MKIRICQGFACTKNFSNYTLDRAKQEALTNPELQIETCGCLGFCEKGPNVAIEKYGDKTIEHKVDGVKLGKILKPNQPV